MARQGSVLMRFPEELVNSFNIKEEVSTGIFEARYIDINTQEETDISVTVKVLPIDNESNKEVMILTALKRIPGCENIIMNNVSTEDKRLFITTTKPAGSHKSLLNYLIDHGIPSEELIQTYFRRLVMVVMGMEESGVRHGNLNLTNVLMVVEAVGNGTEPAPFITHFENAEFSAEILHSAPDEEPLIFPPERSEHGSWYGEATTVWQLAVILHQLFEGVAMTTTGDMNLGYYNAPGAFKKINVLKTASPEVLDLLKKMSAYANERISLREVMMHPWFLKHDFNTR